LSRQFFIRAKATHPRTIMQLYSELYYISNIY